MYSNVVFSLPPACYKAGEKEKKKNQSKASLFYTWHDTVFHNVNKWIFMKLKKISWDPTQLNTFYLK